MLKATNLNEIGDLKSPELQTFLAKRAAELIETYQIDDLQEIGCFVILEQNEVQHFEMTEMEFVEVLNIGETFYLHGVRVLGDCYGEEIFLPVEVVQT